MSKKGRADDKNYNRSVVFPGDMLEQIEKIANKKGVSTSEVIRGFVGKGLSVTGYEDDIELISGIVRQVVSAEIGKQANRLAAMLFKIGVITAGNYFMAVRKLKTDFSE